MGELTAIQKRKEDFKITLEKYSSEIQKLLPETIPPQRFIRVALNACNNYPKLLDCSKASFAISLFEAAALHLEPFVLGQCYIIPYGKKATLIIGYQGYVQLGMRSGKIYNWKADVICENDIFEYVDFPPFLKHIKERTEKERGERIAAYSAVKPVGSIEWIPHLMYAEEIEKRMQKNAFHGDKSSPWKLWPDQMWRKTPVRDHYKFLPISVEHQPIINRALELDNRADIGSDQFKDSEYVEILDEEDKEENGGES